MKTAVVTGAGRGLGRLIAKGLAQKGYAVLVTDVNGAAAEETAREIGGQAWHRHQDVRDPQSHRTLAAEAAARGPLAVWVNNAGVLESGLSWELAEDQVRRQIDVNFTGLVWGAHAAVAEMSKTGGGHIINIASLSSLVPAPGIAVYSATKHAVLGFTVALHGDVRRAGLPIHVSAVCPDAIETDMVHEVQGNEQAALLFSSTKLLKPEDVAAQVLTLVDHPKLLTVMPLHRGALAHLMHPFPALVIRTLEQFRKLGERHRRKRAS